MAQTPAQFYREAVRKGCLHYPNASQASPDFPSYLLHSYHQLREKLQDALLGDAPAAELPSIRRDIAYMAVGLLAYGDVDMVEPILDGLPQVPKGYLTEKIYHLLANSLSALLPLPAAIRPLYAPETTRAWFQAHHQALQWDEEVGKYTL